MLASIALVLASYLVASLIYMGLYYAFLPIPIGIVAWTVYDYRKSK
jgi:hypothetical protein